MLSSLFLSPSSDSLIVKPFLRITSCLTMTLSSLWLRSRWRRLCCSSVTSVVACVCCKVFISFCINWIREDNMTINKMYHKKTYIKCTTYVHEYKMYKKFAGKRLHSQNTLGLCTTSMLDVNYTLFLYSSVILHAVFEIPGIEFLSFANMTITINERHEKIFCVCFYVTCWR